MQATESKNTENINQPTNQKPRDVKDMIQDDITNKVENQINNTQEIKVDELKNKLKEISNSK